MGDISSWNCGNKFIFKEDLVPARRVCQKPHVTVRSGSLAARGLCNPEKPIHLHKDLKTPQKCLCAHSFWNFHNLGKNSFIRSKLSSWCGVDHPCCIFGKKMSNFALLLTCIPRVAKLTWQYVECLCSHYFGLLIFQGLNIWAMPCSFNAPIVTADVFTTHSTFVCGMVFHLALAVCKLMVFKPLSTYVKMCLHLQGTIL